MAHNQKSLSSFLILQNLQVYKQALYLLGLVDALFAIAFYQDHEGVVARLYDAASHAIQKELWMLQPNLYK